MKQCTRFPFKEGVMFLFLPYAVCEMCGLAEEGWSHYILGGRKTIAGNMDDAHKLQKGAVLTGGYYDDKDAQAAAIRRAHGLDK